MNMRTEQLDSNKISFGWNSVTHKAITLKACNRINKFYTKKVGLKPFDAEKLINASILPDLEKNPLESHSADIFERRPNDAYDCFRKYESIVIDDIQQGNNNNIELNIGRALHFLQDMNDPKHVISFEGSISKSEKASHKRFEDSAVLIQKEVLQEAKLNNQPTGDFEQALQDSLEISSKNAKLPQNEQNIKKLKIEGLTNSYKVTYEFLAKLAETVRTK